MWKNDTRIQPTEVKSGVLVFVALRKRSERASVICRDQIDVGMWAWRCASLPDLGTQNVTIRWIRQA
jgi:hypothetical protein